MWLLPWGGNRAREVPYSPMVSHKLGKRMGYMDGFSAFARAGRREKNIVVDQKKALSPLITLHYTIFTYCIPVLYSPIQER